MQESYRKGVEEVRVRPGKKDVSRPNDGATSHPEKGPIPETLLKHKEFIQTSGRKVDEDYRPGEHTVTRHEKKDVEQGGKDGKVEYSFLLNEPKATTTKVDCDPQ